MNNEMTTVLYVDDNARSRSLLGRMLAEYGFEMITAGDPIEVLCRCAEIYFDLALLDYQMHSLTASQLAVDAHFGHGTPLHDLVNTMRCLTNSKPPRVSRTSVTAW